MPKTHKRQCRLLTQTHKKKKNYADRARAASEYKRQSCDSAMATYGINLYVVETQLHKRLKIRSDKAQVRMPSRSHMRWLQLVGSLNLQVSFAKEPYKRDYVLQKRPIILRSLLIAATP